MLYFVHLLLFSSITFFLIGSYVIYLDRNAVLNRVFALFSLSLALWSLSIVLIMISQDAQSRTLASVFAAIGFTTFASISLHFFLIYTKKEQLLKKWWIYLVVYCPPLVFIYQAFIGEFLGNGFIHTQYGWIIVIQTSSIWFWLFTVFYLVTGMLNISMCYAMLKKTTSEQERKQTKIILVAALSSFIVCTVINLSIRIFKVYIPDITVVGLLIWDFGILYAIVRYRLMILTPTVAAENILRTLIDSVILVSPEGKIVSVNPETTRLLGYDSTELIGKPLEMLFPKDTQLEMSNIGNSLKYSPIRNKDTYFVSKSNNSIPIIFSASDCRDKNGYSIGFVAVSRDITHLKNVEGSLKHLAHHDVLTNLPNRLLLNERLNVAIAKAKQNDTYIAFVLLDLDLFKEVNDVYGHNVGDLLLIEVSNRLTVSVRESDTVARLGGDEFVVLLADLPNENDYEITVRRILKHISDPVMIENRVINITASAGVSVYPRHGTDYESLLKCADLAMYRVKDLEKNNFQEYNPSMSSILTKRITLENQLKKSIVNNQLLLEYQPIINVQTGKIIGFEALIRWDNTEYGMLLPDAFLPLAEENGFILDIGEWVLRTACIQAKTWQKNSIQPLYVSVNISAQEFYPDSFTAIIKQILFETKLDPECLILEIKESTAMHDLEKTLIILTELHHLKIKVVIDDFGMGYSTLLYFKNFFIHAIKINKRFIKDITNNSDNASIVSAIIAMAHHMDMIVIAEGIEDLDQFEALCKLKWEYTSSSIIDQGQGFLFCRPITENEIDDLLEKQN